MVWGSLSLLIAGILIIILERRLYGKTDIETKIIFSLFLFIFGVSVYLNI